ncbi:hypothetical protein L13192_10172 [Pyrenophora tritici-repentis]|nr:hypothetical protein L13192_10172 [Pyrenophora tritici-repentis]
MSSARSEEPVGVFLGGGIAPKPFGSEVLEWLLQSLKERFKVTDDQLKRPMQEVLPNWFDAAGRPIKVEKTGNSGESYTVESSEEAELMARQTMALRSAAQFLETVSCRVLHPEDDSEVNAIDGRTKAGRLAKEQREREARLGKKPGMPRMKSSRTASSYEDMDVEEEPEVLRHRAQVEIDDSQDARERQSERHRVREANELHDFQNYEISDEEDGYVEAQSRMPSEARLKGELQQQRYSVKGQLPTCWVSLHGGMGRALIDTGSQLNVMRLSTARALNVYITELD